MNNDVFGKTQENLRNRVSVELITYAHILRVAKLNFYRGNPISDCLTVVQCRVATLTSSHLNGLFSAPVVETCCVKYPCANQLQLLCTDSLAYAVQTDDIYRHMADDASSQYDFSQYPLNQTLYDTSNCKALGFFKDELNSVPTQEFVRQRTVDRNILQHTRPVEMKTAKGVKRKV